MRTGKTLLIELGKGTISRRKERTKRLPERSDLNCWSFVTLSERFVFNQEVISQSWTEIMNFYNFLWQTLFWYGLWTAKIVILTGQKRDSWTAGQLRLCWKLFIFNLARDINWSIRLPIENYPNSLLFEQSGTVSFKISFWLRLQWD